VSQGKISKEIEMGRFSLGLVAVLGIAAAADDKDDLLRAAQKAAEMESYAFKMTVEVEGGPMPMDPMEFEGKYVKDLATYVSGSIPMMGGDFEAYRNGKKTAFKGSDGEWQEFAGRGMGMGMMGRNLRAPHEDLKNVEKMFKNLKKLEAKETVSERECALYEGELTEEAAKSLGGMFGGLGGMGNSEMTGTGRWWVDGDGVIRKTQTHLTILLAMQEGEETELKVVRTSEIKEIGTTKFEIPEEVRSLLEEKKEGHDK